jgi:signal transduction histidine kinase
MERDPGFPGQHRDTLRILSRSGTHLLELINDVLEMSKIEAGKIALNPTSFDFPSFLGDLEEKKGRSAELIERIERISRDHAELAGNLAELVRVHQFDRLISLVREALKENADG